MRRTRTTSPGLKHLAFFQALADTEESTPAYRAATAGLLALRLVDHWVLVGPPMVEPESLSVRSVREAIMAIAANDPRREVLLGLVNAMQTLRDVDIQAVLPRIFAYGDALERSGEFTLAADAYESVIRLGEEEYDGTLVIDSYMRLGYCRRRLGTLTAAETAYESACAIAKRRREHHRLYRSQLGLASVVTSRGNLPQADVMLSEIVRSCTDAGFRDVLALALHDHSIIAHQRGDYDSAVCRAYQALQLTDSDGHRERILGDLGAFFISMGRYQAARDALLIEEATAVEEQVRIFARINVLSLAARLPDQALFESYRDKISKVALTPDNETNFLIESARGLRVFGNAAEAVQLLARAQSIATEHELHRSAHEAESMLAETGIEEPTDRRPTVPSAAAVRVETELRTMAAALAA